MIAPNYNKFCSEAEKYYFDFIKSDVKDSVPIEVINHFIDCNHCRQRLTMLEAMLSESESQPQSQSAITAMLKLHFSLAGKRVNCADVRPFLPNLLTPQMQIRIPTPVTAHIDSCDKCKEDSKKLQNLGLTPKQLVTLSQLFADVLEAGKKDCNTAHYAIPSVVAMDFDRADAKALRHLCLCVKCREELYRYREEIIEQLKSGRGAGENQEKRFPCASIDADDVFDYGIPYGIDPAGDEYTKFRKSLTAHIAGCADCLEKIQQLHKTVYGIVQRPESGVVTVFNIDRAAEVKPQAETENPYAGFPVSVERVASGSREQAHSEEYGKVVKLKPASRGLRSLLKVAIPVAAVFMLGIGLFYNIHTAKGLPIAKIYSAIEMVKNIHLSNYDADNQRLIQEIWISRNYGLHIIKTGNQCVLRDITSGIHKTRNPQTGTIDQTSLSSEALTNIAAQINGSADIMTFAKPSDIPEGSKWSEITDSSLVSKNSNIKVYELSWPQVTPNGSTITRIRRISVDVSTNLPQKIQYLKQDASDLEPVLETFMIIEYPGNEEFLSKARDMSF